MRGLEPAVVDAILTDWRSAPVDGRLRAALEFLEKVTLTPAEVTAADARALLGAGVRADAVRELLYVCFLFNVLDRLADGLDFELPSERTKARMSFLAEKLGYGVAKLPG